MDHHDQRKRAFSQAFQLMNQPRLSDYLPQPAKRISSYPFGPTGFCDNAFDQENEVPLDLEYNTTPEETSETQIRYKQPALIGFQYGGPTLYDFSSMYVHQQGLGLQVGVGDMSRPVIQNQLVDCLPSREPSPPTPLIVSGHSMFGPSPYIRPDLNSSALNGAHNYPQNSNEFTIYEDTNSLASDATTAAGPLTPSALNFGGLSLSSQGSSGPPSPRHNSLGNRATVSIAPASSFSSLFAAINPNEVIVLFDRGKEIKKVDKYPLCSSSRFFSQLLDGPFLDHGFTRCVRLRDDFPYAVGIMLHFIETGHYVFDPRAFAKFPLLTTLDFHIHAYLVSSKYDIPTLRDCAMNAYLGVAEHEINLGFLVLSGGQLSDVQVAATGFPVTAPADGPAGCDNMITPMDRFLNSLVLLWKNTQSQHDAMRHAVLELVKRDLSKFLRVSFFITLMQEVVGFGDDLVTSLEDDGLSAGAFEVAAYGRQDRTMRFSV